MTTITLKQIGDWTVKHRQAGDEADRLIERAKRERWSDADPRFDSIIDAMNHAAEIARAREDLVTQYLAQKDRS